ncbi:DNA-directed RNA polymerase subunit beta [Candidatus Vidania fulgoroideorum]
MILKKFINNNIFKLGKFIIPYTLEIQKKSFRMIFDKKNDFYLGNVFKEFFPIVSKDFSIKVEYNNFFVKDPLINSLDSRFRKFNYFARFYLSLDISFFLDKKNNLFYKKIRKNFLLCYFPVMLDSSSFLINGIERTIVSQIYKSPGIFLDKDLNNSIIRIVPNKGAWLEIMLDKRGRFFFKINKKKKMNILILLKCFNINTDKIFNSICEKTSIYILNGKVFIKFTALRNYNYKYNLYDNFGKFLSNSIRNVPKSVLKKSYVLLNKRLHSNIIISSKFKFKNKTFKKNTKLNIKKILHLISENERVEIIVFNMLYKNINYNFFDSLISKKELKKEDCYKKIFQSLNPNKFSNYELSKKFFYNLFLNLERYNFSKYVRELINKKINSSSNSMLITSKDIVLFIKFLIKVKNFSVNDMDGLDNKKVRGVGNFINSLFEKKFPLLRTNFIERISKIKKMKHLNNILNNRILTSFVNEFFCTSQFSQYLDQNNILSEITHKRRVTLLGTGGLKKGMISNKARDIHFTNYGRICPIETPEGQNIGLVNSFAVMAKLDRNGFLKTSYFKLYNLKVIRKIHYLISSKEEELFICGSYNIGKNLFIKRKNLFCRKGKKIQMVKNNKVNLVDIASFQVFSIATLMIPFVEHNDANRALMGSNMLRQSIVGSLAEIPFLLTGFEKIPSHDLCYSYYFKRKGIILYGDSKRILIEYNIKKVFIYKVIDFLKFSFSNQKNFINNKIILNFKNKIIYKNLLNDNTNTKNGKLALGHNLLTAFIPFYGYNFEDSIIISEKVVNSDMYTSFHVNEISVDIKRNKYGVEISNKHAFYISKKKIGKLDGAGLMRIGTYAEPGDVLICKLTPKKRFKYSPEEKFIKSIFSTNFNNYKKSFIKVPRNIDGILSKITFIDRKGIRVEDGNKKKKNTLVFNRKILKKFLFKRFLKNFKIKYNIPSKNIIIFKNKIICNILLKKKPFYNLIILNNRILNLFEKLKISKKKVSFRLNSDTERKIIFTIFSKRRLQIGDKMSGRHGNKGVISKILPTEDMPYLNDGTPCDLILNPLGVPSRMNLGQLLELNFGLILFILIERINKYINENEHKKIKNIFNKINPDLKINYYKKNINYYKNKISILSLPFEGAGENELNDLSNKIINNKNLIKFKFNFFKNKLKLKNGYDGIFFKDYVSVGYMYFLKLHHIAHEKIHARSIGPYSLVTQQPLKGRSRLGGQRFGEMEVWALEAYGAAYTLQEMITIKSDDIKGREINYENISFGKNNRKFNIPESFKILLKEIKCLCLNIELK